MLLPRGALFVLRQHRQPSRKEQFVPNRTGEDVPYSPIARQLLGGFERLSGRVFHGPETTPTGARNEGSAIGGPTAQDDHFLPGHPAGGLDESLESEWGFALFA